MFFMVCFVHIWPLTPRVRTAAAAASRGRIIIVVGGIGVVRIGLLRVVSAFPQA